MNDEELEFNEELKMRLSDDGMSYFYHITGKGNGENIINDGLLLAENRLFSTTLPIDDEFKECPLKFFEEEINNSNIRKQEEMVIIGCESGEVEDLIQKNDNSNNNWVQDFDAEYVIPSEYIMGYIDLEEKKFIENEEYKYYDDSMLFFKK